MKAEISMRNLSVDKWRENVVAKVHYHHIGDCIIFFILYNGAKAYISYF